MKKFDLSIVIVNFNTKELVLDCLKSIAKHRKGLKIEVIIIDNASTKGEIVKPNDTFPPRLEVKVINNDKNLGFAAANNQGIKKSSARYILLLNSDTVVTENALQVLLKFAKSSKRIGVVGPRLLNADKSFQGSVFRLPTLWRTISQYLLGNKGLLDKYTPDLERPVKVEAVSMACMLITPQCLKKVGLLDESYFMYFEDLDYCRRISQKGLDIYFQPHAKVIHYHGMSGRKLAKSKDQWKRLIPSSKIYHGNLKHYLIIFVSRVGQKILNNA